MFEIGIFCVIIVAIGYWATLFIMGRREDVLHGQFVEEDAASETAAPVPVSPVPTRPRVQQPVAPLATEASAQELMTVSEPPAPEPTAAPSAPVAIEIPPPVPAPMPAPAPALSPMPSANPEKLKLLLASLKQELKNAAQI